MKKYSNVDPIEEGYHNETWIYDISSMPLCDHHEDGGGYMTFHQCRCTITMKMGEDIMTSISNSCIIRLLERVMLVSYRFSRVSRASFA